MKTCWRKILIVPLIMAVTVAPLCAEENPGNGTNVSTPTNPAPPAAPAAPAPPSDEPTTNNATNGAPAAQKKHKGPGDRAPVRIDGSGIHVGGPNPVDLNIDMPGLPNPGGFGKSGIPLVAVLIPIVAIITPFAFLAACVGFFLYFRFRRNRMLHETIRQMIDKGVPIPPELLAPPARVARVKARNDLRNGLVMIAIGLGLTVVRFRGGWILVFVGAAFLIIWYIEKKAALASNDTINK